MSTKIYNGFRFVPEKTSNRWREVIVACETFRKNAEEEVNKFLISKIMHTAIVLFDKIYYGVASADQRTPFYDALDFVSNQVKEAAVSREYHPYDVCVSLSFYQLRNGVYGQYFGRHDLVNKYWLSNGQVKDFHYQDQTDRPEEISSRDWNFRKKVWDEIFYDYEVTPINVGLISEIIPHNYSVFKSVINSSDLDRQAILDSVSFSSRVKALAIDNYISSNKNVNMYEVSKSDYLKELVAEIDKSKLKRKLKLKDLLKSV